MKRFKRKPTKAPAKVLPPEAFDATPRCALVFTDETMYLTCFSERGVPLASYPVLASDVASVFNPFGSDTGLLGPATLFWQKRGERLRIGVWLPAQVRELRFTQGRRELALRVPLPGFVFVGKGIEYSIFAAAERPERESEYLYRAPLPNVHPNGTICAGNVKFPKANPETLPQAATLFFESLFNADLSTDKVESQVRGPAQDDADEDDDDMPLEEDGDGIDPLHQAHGRVRPRKEISLFNFLRGLQSKKVFPNAEELIRDIAVKQLLEEK